MNNIFHVKVIKRFTFYVKLIDDKRKTYQEKYWVTCISVEKFYLSLIHGILLPSKPA